MSSLRFCFTSLTICSPRTLLAIPPQRINTFCCCAKPSRQNDFISEANALQSSPPSASPKHSPFFGMDDTLVSYLCGKKKATDLAHMVWKHVVQKGDTVLDATCGNGFDTLAMLNLVADDSRKGYVFALDIQKDALDSTSILLEESLNLDERQLVKLVNICHSKMEEVVPRNALVRLVAFNLGYLPGGKKEIITRPETTFLALEAAERILMPGGLISIVVYVGHPGGREELEAVETFAARMPVENWICCKLRMVNRPCAPVPIFLFRR
ncbi:hypothetical protein HN51_026237 [Arachis hypogaea]|uniref:Uncharacterized protein LOC107458583 isoform X2 n=1 Tax=Arachis duranensis TaxID=130453 RepID=A0A6P4BWI0_ARADU|nr:uncharacterized protein LOC107458583 isoform X2 [Arachis duranensis]XP_025610596.1 uncharacterized protein LOC112703389 [Arachis hypogaea]QHO28795.1 Putative rRNA methylase YtqB [Arachis hypogaea]